MSKQQVQITTPLPPLSDKLPILTDTKTHTTLSPNTYGEHYSNTPPPLSSSNSSRSLDGENTIITMNPFAYTQHTPLLEDLYGSDDDLQMVDMHYEKHKHEPCSAETSFHPILPTQEITPQSSPIHTPDARFPRTAKQNIKYSK
jgi:hypothetical protein